MAAEHIGAARDTRMVAIIAHRGARSLAPENTLAAARKAHALGADLWETDTAITADDQIVLMHDDAMTRTTDVAEKFPDRVPAPFSTYTLAEIRTLDAGSWFERDDPFGQVAAGAVERSELCAYVGERVPTLREAFELTLELDWHLNLELKAQPKPKDTFDVVGAVLALADEVGIGPDHLLFSSARHAWLKTLKACRPEFEVQAILGLFPEDAMDFSDPFFDTFNPRITRITVEQLGEQLARGIKLNPFAVNEPDAIEQLIQMGVTGLITDFPQRGVHA
jgi:glycerophosphoryl diester phosphodiesterase